MAGRKPDKNREQNENEHGGSGRVPASPDPEWDKLSQCEKFIHTAREVEASETGDALDEALRKIGKMRHR